MLSKDQNLHLRFVWS